MSGSLLRHFIRFTNKKYDNYLFDLCIGSCYCLCMEWLSVGKVSLLFLAGLVAGIINTLAGGGSSITVPALILMGVPGTAANGTNRVSVLLQCLSGVQVYAKKGMIDRKGFLAALWPALSGGVFGAWLATIIPNSVFEPLIFAVMVLFSLYLLFQKGGKENRVEQSGGLVRQLLLFSAGLYGGFLQTGVGIYLLFVLHGAAAMELSKANAYKMALVLPFTGAALLIFVYQDLVLWVPGLVLAAGSALGARVTALHSGRFSKNAIRWVTFAIVTGMTLFYMVRKL